MAVVELDWDEENEGHLARHPVTRAEVDELFNRPYAIDFVELEDEEDRFLAHGTTARGRYLTVVYTERAGRIRPITAWPMTKEDLETHADEIHE